MVVEEVIYQNQKENFLNFMKSNNLNPNSWAKKAGISEATIRHFISGRNKSITTASLEKLANSVNVSSHEIISSNKINSHSLIVNRELFIQSFCEIEQIIKNNYNHLPAHHLANIILSWYELSTINKDSKSIKPIQEIMKTLVASFS